LRPFRGAFFILDEEATIFNLLGFVLVKDEMWVKGEYKIRPYNGGVNGYFLPELFGFT
jgi:hypothetical protein